jgi:Uma2 family endonuclease
MAVYEPTRTAVGLPMDEFLRLSADETPFELIDGERIALVATVSNHGEIIIFLLELLFGFKKSAGIVYYTETAFVLTYSPDWVTGSRIPDIMIYQAERMTAYKQNTPNWRDLPLILVPDLCVEVVSPTDKFTDVETKVQRYLNDGVRVVWVIDSGSRSVLIYTAESKQRTQLDEDDTLVGGALIPGFSVRVGDILDA